VLLLMPAVVRLLLLLSEPPHSAPSSGIGSAPCGCSHAMCCWNSVLLLCCLDTLLLALP